MCVKCFLASWSAVAEETSWEVSFHRFPMSGRVWLTFVNVTKQRFHFPISQHGSFGGFFSSDHSATSFNFHQAQNNLTLFWKKK